MKKPAKASDGKHVDRATAHEAQSGSSPTQTFAEAMRHFHAGNYSKAKPLFDEAAAGSTLNVTESAKMYSLMCEQRISKERIEPESAEDHYNYAITLLNGRRLDDAVRHLNAALASKEDAAHVHYALSLGLGLGGDISGAKRHLQRAIELDPGSRNLASNDSDFQPLLEHPEIRNLVYEESGSGR
jgi:tetratricopeptide (TPR) repeat protein